jgi:predicted DNA-binding ribbon-helix-helix protein
MTGEDRSLVRKHSLVIAGHRTSVSLEALFWDALGDLAREKGLSIATLAADIDSARGKANLSSALRVYALQSFRDKSAALTASAAPATAHDPAP